MADDMIRGDNDLHPGVETQQPRNIDFLPHHGTKALFSAQSET